MSGENAYQQPVTLKNVLMFSVPTIVMTVFMSFYTMVDGLFVSNLIGTDALSAVNLTAPVISLVTAISTMLATGGSAVIMRKAGQQKAQEANEDFTFLIAVNVAVGLIMSGLGYLIMDRLFERMSLSPAVAGYCRIYLSRYLIFTVPILLMNNFTLYMIAAGKSALSMVCSITGGILNIVLDYVFISILDMGIAGAAIATGLGYSVTAVAGLVIFQKRLPAPFCKARVQDPDPGKRCFQRKLGNGGSSGDWHRHYDVQLDHAEICGRKRCGGHNHHHVRPDVRHIPVYRLFLWRSAHDQLLLWRAEPG